MLKVSLLGQKKLELQGILLQIGNMHTLGTMIIASYLVAKWNCHKGSTRLLPKAATSYVSITFTNIAIYLTYVWQSCHREESFNYSLIQRINAFLRFLLIAINCCIYKVTTDCNFFSSYVAGWFDCDCDYNYDILTPNMNVIWITKIPAINCDLLTCLLTT